MDADALMDIWKGAAASASREIIRQLNTHTEEMLSTLKVGESLAVHVNVAQSIMLFQVLAPGDVPRLGFEWTVYGPKV